MIPVSIIKWMFIMRCILLTYVIYALCVCVSCREMTIINTVALSGGWKEEVCCLPRWTLSWHLLVMCSRPVILLFVLFSLISTSFSSFTLFFLYCLNQPCFSIVWWEVTAEGSMNADFYKQPEISIQVYFWCLDTQQITKLCSLFLCVCLLVQSGSDICCTPWRILKSNILP